MGFSSFFPCPRNFYQQLFHGMITTLSIPELQSEAMLLLEPQTREKLQSYGKFSVRLLPIKATECHLQQISLK